MLIKHLVMKKILKQIQKKIESLSIDKNDSNSGTKKIDIERLPKLTNPIDAPQMEIVVSSWTVIKILFIAALFLAGKEILFELKSIVMMTALSGLLALGLSPFLDKLERFKIPRPLAILILYVLFLGVLAIVFVQVLPIIADQLLGIAKELKHFVFSPNFEIPFIGKLGLSIETADFQTLIADNLTSISNNLQNVAGSTFSLVGSIFQGIFNFMFTLILLFFILLEREQIAQFLLLQFKAETREYLYKKTTSVQTKMAHWFKGQIIVMVVVGLGMYVGMKIFELSFGLEYAATIAIVAGVMELFPYVGVAITTILAGVIAANVSMTALFFVLGWMAVVQFLEGNILIPLVMEKAVGLSSVVVILALAIAGTLGFALGGITVSIMGMIFAIPLAAIGSIFIDSHGEKK